MNNEKIDRIEKKRKTANKVFSGLSLFGFILVFIGIPLQISSMAVVGAVFFVGSILLSACIDKAFKKQIRELGGVPRPLNQGTGKRTKRQDTDVQGMINEVRSTPIDSRQEDWDDYEKCPYCGEKNDFDATFCKKCGKRIK